MILKHCIIALFISLAVSANALNVAIIESTSFNAGHVMDSQWQTVASGMGHTATIQPQTFLDNTTFFGTTDVLIVSSGVINISAARVNVIQQFMQAGKSVYIQTEYDCSYESNGAFNTIVANLGGTFNWVSTTAGTLAPMNVLGTFANTNNSVPNISYYWYSCHGNPGCYVFPFLEYGGEYHGFYFCPPNSSYGKLATTTDQDWVNQGTSFPLMENILTHLINTNLCQSVSSIPLDLGNDTTLCSGNLIIDGTTPGATYLWNTGATTPTITVSTTGTYYLTVSAGGCSATDTIHVTYANNLTVNLGNDTTLCPGTLTLNATTTGATYLWSTGATTPTINVNSTGNYSVTISIGSCTATDNINVTFSNPLTVNLGNDTTLCPGTLTLDATTTGVTYLWSTGATTPTINVNSTGNYSVTISSGGCTATDAINVTFSNTGSVNLGNDTSVCVGPFTLDATTAGATYLWSTAETTPAISVNTGGNYSVTVTVGGCTATDDINISFGSLAVNLGPDQNTCVVPVVLNATTPGATYLWSDGSTNPNLSVNNSGQYFVEVNAGGCIGNDTVNITITAPPVINLGNDTTFCGNSLLLDATTSNATYLWNNSATTPTLSTTTSGIYSVTVTVNGCSDTDSIQITMNSAPVFSIGNDTTLCTGQSINLSAIVPGASFLWSNGNTTNTITASATGIYWVQVTQNGCMDTDSLQLQIIPPPVVNLGNDTVFCYGTFPALTLNAGNPGANYLWHDGTNAQTVDVFGTGTYFVTANVGACVDRDTIVITQSGYVDLGPDQSLCGLDEVTFDAGNPGSAYLWSTGETTQQITVTDPGTYSVTMLDGNCVSTDLVLVEGALNGAMIFAPNAFSPNKDGTNDIFYVTAPDADYFSIYIFNRWGEKIFESNSVNSGWDGTFKGRTVENGVYVYLIDYSSFCTDGVIVRKTGSITLVK